MHSSQDRNTSRHATDNAEEDRAWTHLYRRADDPAIAAEVAHLLEGDAEARRSHLALYLRCRYTLRQRKARQARRQRVRRLLRAALSMLALKSTAAMRWFASSGRVAELRRKRDSKETAQQGPALRPVLIEALSRRAASSRLADSEVPAAASAEEAA